MDYYSYLSQPSIELVRYLSRKKVKIAENGSNCNNREIFGFFKNNSLTICTNNIKNKISPVGHYVNETLLHESVHFAQGCRGGPLRPPNMELHDHKLQDAKKSAKAFYGADYIYEKEAYFLEDKPDLVLYYVKKYCM